MTGPRAEAVALRIERYSSPEPNTGCTLWMGPVDGSGYPVLLVARKMKRITRLILGLGGSPLLALHRCDTPVCIAPRHLFAGTQAENNADRDRKGRNAFSRRTHCAKGHAFDEANTYRFRNQRCCRACNRATKARQVGK